MGQESLVKFNRQEAKQMYNLAVHECANMVAYECIINNDKPCKLKKGEGCGYFDNKIKQLLTMNSERYSAIADGRAPK